MNWTQIENERRTAEEDKAEMFEFYSKWHDRLIEHAKQLERRLKAMDAGEDD
jgi:hypothetical protein